MNPNYLSRLESFAAGAILELAAREKAARAKRAEPDPQEVRREIMAKRSLLRRAASAVLPGAFPNDYAGYSPERAEAKRAARLWSGFTPLKPKERVLNLVASILARSKPRRPAQPVVPDQRPLIVWVVTNPDLLPVGAPATVQAPTKVEARGVLKRKLGLRYRLVAGLELLPAGAGRFRGRGQSRFVRSLKEKLAAGYRYVTAARMAAAAS